MKRHIQYAGVRHWYGDDLIDLEAEPMKVLDGFLTEFGNCVISGCRVTANGATYNVSPGLVALQGKGPDGTDMQVVAPFDGAEGAPMPLYLTLRCDSVHGRYGNQNLQPIAYVYKAVGSGIRPLGSHVQLSAEGCLRFTDVLQDSLHRFITDAERSLWNGKETPAGAQAKADEALVKACTYADAKETPAGAQTKADNALALAKAYADRKETPEGAQTKANNALSNAKTYTDQALVSAKAYADRKETPEGAQTKANNALSNAKTYTDQAQQAAQRYTDNAVAKLVDAPPAALDTLRKLAGALGNDANFAATMQTQLNGKVDKVAGKRLSTNDFTDDDKKYVQFSYHFDYLVESNGDLAGLHRNTDAHSVLIRKGSWVFTSPNGKGIELLPNVQHIVAEAGAVLVFNNVEEGSCLSYSSGLGQQPVNTSLCRVEGLVIKNNSPAGTPCFGRMYNLYNCYGYFDTDKEVTAFIDCEHLDSCEAGNKGTAGKGTGFRNCHTLYNCKADKNLLLGYGSCSRLIACRSETPHLSPRQGFNHCTDMTDCVALSTISYGKMVRGCVASDYKNSYASPDTMAAYACANTFEGGWNRTL